MVCIKILLNPASFAQSLYKAPCNLIWCKGRDGEPVRIVGCTDGEDEGCADGLLEGREVGWANGCRVG